MAVMALVGLWCACRERPEVGPATMDTPVLVALPDAAVPTPETLATAEPAVVVAQHLRAVVPAREAAELEAHLTATARGLQARLQKVQPCEVDEVLLALQTFVAENLQEKYASKFPLDAAHIRRHVIDAEA